MEAWEHGVGSMGAWGHGVGSMGAWGWLCGGVITRERGTHPLAPRRATRHASRLSSAHG